MASASNYGGSVPVVEQILDRSIMTPTSSSEDGFFNGFCQQHGYYPNLTWQLCFYEYVEGSIFPPIYEPPAITLNSNDSKSAALLDMSCTIDRTNQINTMDLTLDNTNFHATNQFRKDMAVLFWYGYKNGAAFTPFNPVFGGFISDYDNLNVIDQKLKLTVSAWERMLVFDKYKVTAKYENIELSELIGKLLKQGGFSGMYQKSSTNITAYSYACANKRLADCISQVIDSLNSYINTTDPSKNWKKCTQASSTSTASNLSETDKAGADSMGQLCGTPKQYWWDFWIDSNLTAHFEPLKAKTTGSAYQFYYSENLVGYERKKKGEFDVTPQAHDDYTMEVPIIADINIFSNNIIACGPPNNTTGFLLLLDNVTYRVDQIDYTFPGTTMKITCRKILDATTGALTSLLTDGSSTVGGASSKSDSCKETTGSTSSIKI